MNIGDYIITVASPKMTGQIVQKFDGRKAIVIVDNVAIMADLKYWVKKS